MFVFLLLTLASTAAAQQCSECDCYHVPFPKQCEHCCGFDSGKISSVTKDKVVLEEKSSTSDAVTVKKTFALTPETKKNADLKEGAQATVYHPNDKNVATKVDLTEALSGLLVPGTEPDPPVPESCTRFGPLPSNALKVYLGGNLGYTTSDEVTVLNVRGTDVIDLRRTSEGLAFNAKTYSEDGKIIAQIVDNRFFISPGNSFRIERPTTHSLVVYDLRERKVMDINYINPLSLRVLGIFEVPGTLPLIVSENELSFGGIHSTGSCFGGRTLFKFK